MILSTCYYQALANDSPYDESLHSIATGASTEVLLSDFEYMYVVFTCGGSLTLEIEGMQVAKRSHLLLSVEKRIVQLLQDRSKV